jgi:predicted small lipoprotein YifL
MRTLLLASLAALALCTGCGQKGPLVLRQKSVATPVVIRAPATAPAAESAVPPATPAATPAPKKSDEPEPPPPPPPRR